MVSFRKVPSDSVEIIRAAAWPLIAGRTYERILTWLGDATVVLLGAATQGTHDFEAARAALTRRLIEDRNFSAVAVDGDWQDAREINRYVQGLGGRDPAALLRGFTRFPSWMWRNTAMAEFAAWLHEHNMSRPDRDRVGFYGLDLLSLRASMRGVVEYLATADPVAGRAARSSFAAFEQAGEDAGAYAWAPDATSQASRRAIIRQLLSLRERRADWLRHDGPISADEAFYLRQEEWLTEDAEGHYDALISSRLEGWNGHARHLDRTLHALAAELQRHGRPPKIVVWANNAQAGDARAADGAVRGEVSLGQLARLRYGAAVRSIGLTTYSGTVVAASDWGGAVQVRSLQPALEASYEELFHRVGMRRFFLPLLSGAEVRDVLAERRLERSIGMVYQPEQERWSHYVGSNLTERYDAVIHVDSTSALEPLERVAEWETPPATPSEVTKSEMLKR
jgi:erythromycin esterase-like protein